MLKVARPIVTELLAKHIEQGRALLERASLVGDPSDYEGLKAAREQWIELTAETLAHIYDGSAEVDEFKRAATAVAGGDRWQLEYARDLECTRAAIDVLISLEERLESAHEPAAGSAAEPNPFIRSRLEQELTSAPPLEREPAGGSELAQERPDESELTQERPVGTELTGERPDDSELAQERPDDSELAQERPDDSELAQERPVGSELALERPAGSQLAPAPSVDSVAAQESSGGAEFGQQSPNGSLSAMPAATSVVAGPGRTRRVFLVHGPNERWKQAVVRLLERAGPHPVTTMNERPNDRETIVEQFEQQGTGSSYAIVLLTADDVGGPQVDSQREPYFSPRACQSVVFQMGVLVAVLTPRYVCVLYEDGVELPCELDGIAYVRLDLAGTWQSKLLLRLRGAGFDYDLNRLAPV
jgi:predicted nucleotide-binding protein